MTITAKPATKPTTRLRELLAADGLIVAPFILNALHARIAESVGFNAVYMTGAGTSAEKGFPDVGMLTMTEMVTNARYIANAVDIPVICDADTGYGNALTTQRTVREYESAGVAGIHIEDQVFPKKCGFFEGKQVVPMEEHVQKDTRRPGRPPGPGLRHHRPLRRLRRYGMGGHGAPLQGLPGGRGRHGLCGRHQVSWKTWRFTPGTCPTCPAFTTATWPTRRT